MAAGRNPALLDEGGLWPDHIIEVEPDGTSGGTIVWEWHVWDHLIQDYDPTKDNYGTVADHPGLIDLNFVLRGSADWTHMNSVAYNAELDQVVLSLLQFSEIWIIDHSTTTAEAAGHTGGRSGKGGDLLYRWGNPQAYGAGTSGNQQLFGQHDAEWIAEGLPGEGNILIFNNGGGRPDGNYSSVVEIEPPLQPDGTYGSDLPFGPDAPVWTYEASPKTDFYAVNISGSQRLPNGNTLICSGPQGWFFEVTEEGDTVWEYNYGAPVFRVERYALSYPGLNPGEETELVLDLGEAGLWLHNGEDEWMVTSLNPDLIAPWWGESSLVADFPGYGVYRYDGDVFSLISWLNPEDAVSLDGTIVLDYGTYGTWAYDGSDWEFITVADPESMVSWGDLLVLACGIYGTWAYDGGEWTYIHPLSPEGMVAWDGSLAMDFGDYGVYEFDGDTWAQINTGDPEQMAVWNDELVFDFGPDGVYAYDGSTERLLTADDPEDMVAWGDDLVFDLGDEGVWGYDGDSWEEISDSDPEDMTVVDLPVE